MSYITSVDALVSVDPQVIETFERKGQTPRSVIVCEVGEVYFQCVKALMRSALWMSDSVDGLPTAGEFVREQEAGFDAEGYDAGYADCAKDRMW